MSYSSLSCFRSESTFQMWPFLIRSDRFSFGQIILHLHRHPSSYAFLTSSPSHLPFAGVTWLDVGTEISWELLSSYSFSHPLHDHPSHPISLIRGPYYSFSITQKKKERGNPIRSVLVSNPFLQVVYIWRQNKSRREIIIASEWGSHMQLSSSRHVCSM